MLDSNHHARWLCHCAGLPEEKAIVKAVVQRKYAVVAFSSMDRGGSRCWSLDASTNSSDLSKVPSSANLRSITYLQTNKQTIRGHGGGLNPHIPIHRMQAMSPSHAISKLTGRILILIMVIRPFNSSTLGFADA